MMLEYMKQCFPNYTDAMWYGEEPSSTSRHEHLYGEHCDSWNTEWGVGQTYGNGKIAWVSVIVPDSDGVKIDVCDGDVLNICKAGVTVCRQWTNADDRRYSNFTRWPVKEYAPEEIRRFMDKFPDTLFYKLVVSEAKRIYTKETGYEF